MSFNLSYDSSFEFHQNSNDLKKNEISPEIKYE